MDKLLIYGLLGLIGLHIGIYLFKIWEAHHLIVQWMVAYGYDDTWLKVFSVSVLILGAATLFYERYKKRGEHK